jgi:hypothetical protein
VTYGGYLSTWWAISDQGSNSIDTVDRASTGGTLDCEIRRAVDARVTGEGRALLAASRFHSRQSTSCLIQRRTGESRDNVHQES